MVCKEYDLAAWRRKFQECYVVWNKDNQLSTVYVNSIGNSGELIVAHVSTSFAEDVKLKLISDKDSPEYHHVKSGWYKTQAPNGYMYIERIPSKGFNIGINENTHIMRKVCGNSKFPDLVSSPVVPYKQAITKGGALSRRVFISPVLEIYYRDQIVGEMDGEHPIVNANFSYVEQEVRDAIYRAQQNAD